MRHQGRFTRPSTDREVDKCIYRTTRSGQWTAGTRISVTEERQTFFIQSSTLKAQKLSSYLFAGDILYREVKKGYTRRQTSTWSASAFLTKDFRTAHSKPWTKGRCRAWKTNFSDTFKQPTVLPEERPQSGTRLKTTTFNSTVQLSDTRASRTTVLSSSGHLTLVQHKYYKKDPSSQSCRQRISSLELVRQQKTFISA